MRHGRVNIVRDIVCRPRIEIEVSPARAQLYFADERWIDPINTELRFEATWFNTDAGVTWRVLAPGGGPGLGSIDATGLYRAPAKGGLVSGVTDMVSATANADPLRKAFAWVTLVGLGPSPVPPPRIGIWPKTRTLFYQSGEDNSYISDSNKLQMFQAEIRDSADNAVRWLVNGVPQPGNEPFFLYRAPNTGSTQHIGITAQIQSQAAVASSAKVVLLNYFWPGL